MAKLVTVNDVLDGHVVLDLECLDRIHLNVNVPNLQVGGRVADRKIEVMRPYRAAQAATGRSGVAAWAAWGGPGVRERVLPTSAIRNSQHIKVPIGLTH
ncbi:MAG: hypothetical protein M3Z25_20010 [Actinomycetota bacterium]|nr:hypothetical protein [Actinomycetota bacterium]